MTSAIRGTKAGGGGTNFSAGTTILNDEVDADFNAIITVVNGNLDNANLIGSADIVQTKIADHGTLTAQTTPGTPEAPGVPTTLAADVEMLRFALGALKYGKATNGTDLPADQGGELEWFERSQNWLSGANNLLKNSSFAAFQNPASTSAPDDWATVGPATQYDHTALVAGDGLELGHYLKVTGSGAANTGVSQTIATTSLRPSTTYQVFAMAWASAGDAAHLTTTGAGTNLDISTSSLTPQLMQGFFTTDATPSAVTINLLSTGAADVSNWYAVRVLPLTFVPRRQGYNSAFLQIEGDGTAISSTGVALALGATNPGAAGYSDVTVTAGAVVLRRSITVPGPGFRLKVTARVCAAVAGAANSGWFFALEESTDNEVTYTCRDCTSVFAIGVTTFGNEATLAYVADATPGAKYFFKVMGAKLAGSQNILPQVGTTAGVSYLLVELMPKGE